MSNIQVTPGSGKTVATETIGGIEYQLIKLIDPTAASTTGIGIAANPLYVQGAVTSTPSGTQTVTGTVTANAGTNLNTSLLALETGGNLASIKTDVDNLNLSQGSTTSGQKGNLTLGATTTAAPTYTTAQSNPLSLTTSGALRIDGSGSTQPISATNLSTNIAQVGGTNTDTNSGSKSAGTIRVVLATDQPALSNKLLVTPDLPSGASTAAKQPALGTAGSASADVITIQGITSMTPLIVSGTVTANAGTNLNTSLLAVESGGNLASIKTDVDNLNLAQASTTSGQKGNLTLGAVTTAAPTYTTAQSNPLSLTIAGALRVDNSANTQPVSLAAETTKVIGVVRNADGSGNLLTSTSAALDVNIKSGTTSGSGTATGAIRVELPTNGTGVVGLNTGTNSIGKISDITTSVVPGTGATNLGKAEDAASASGDTGVFALGVRNDTVATVPTTADGDYSQISTDKYGRVLSAYVPRTLKVTQQTTITSSVTETTVLTAVTSTFLDVYGCIVANTSATACDVTFKDGTAGTTRFNIYVPAGETRGFMLPSESAHVQSGTNANWTATCGTSVASIKITMLAVKAT